jgi:hypothetical protein
MRQPYRSLTAVLVLLGVAAFAVALVLLNDSRTADVNAELGKWLLTVAAGLLITGAVSVVVKHIDQRRIDREAWHTVLNDLVAANQTVMLARSRLAAHRSALTYQEQFGELMRVRVELRRISAIGIVVEDRQLRQRVIAMRGYLTALWEEYQAGYLHVARQQRLDELWLTGQMKAAMEGSGEPVLPGRLGEPTEAWRLLEQSARFPRLAALLTSEVFDIDAFRTNYKVAKRALETHAGFRGATRSASAAAGLKLSDRTETFVKLHPGLPAKAAERMACGRTAVKLACDSLDPHAIDAAVAELNEATVAAINAAYHAPSRDVPVGEDPAPGTGGQPAASPL